MPGRQSHGGAPSKKPKVRTNSKKRSLDAFAIASHQNPENIKIRKNRLGASEGGNRPHKRTRDDDEDEDEETEQAPKKQRKGPEKGRFDELDLDQGSDSEGNEWKLGQVDSDDDSDLDSDEAFGESDDERFEGFAFSGSSDKKSKKKSSKPRDVDLNEDSAESSSDSELEEGDLGEDAVDLADMLDATDEDEDMDEKHPRDEDISMSEDDEEEESSDDDSSASSVDEDEASNQAKISALQNLVANLDAETSRKGQAKQHNDSASEYSKPSNFGLTARTKLTLEDLGLPSISDPQIKQSLKFLDPEAEGKRKGVPKRLEVPLAKRQQDRLDRDAAYDKSKETLDRWTDTVKHNRRADHLMFPLRDHDMESAHSNKKLQPTSIDKPFNELEATIQSILEESGLATANGKDDEDYLREFEEQQTNRMSLEEVKSKRAQLRMARELLFREEAKAKRIKKIKSKSYRKVHRKQREKEERLNQEALAEGGFVPSEDEVEKQDRRRATERMGQKHRGSKWAKATKESGRAAWDEDARAGISEMARRDEELRKRVEGKTVRKEFENDSEGSTSDSEEESGNDDDEEGEQARLLRRLDAEAEIVDDKAPGSKLANMKFMRKAEESRKQANDAMVKDIRRELEGRESSSEEEEHDIGRRVFGAGKSQTDSRRPTPRDEFEEPRGSDDEDDEVQIAGLDDEPKQSAKELRSKAKPLSKLLQPAQSRTSDSVSEGGAWSKVTSKSNTVNEAEARRRRHKKNDAVEVEELDLSKAAVMASQQPQTKKSRAKSATKTLDVSSYEDSDDEGAVQLPFAIRDQELIKRAFAGADVVGDFEAEKKQTIEDEDEKIVDNALPGWGSWIGEGVSKREKKRNKGKFLTKTEGIKEQNRKDAKLARVIINEKIVKKNGKYLASSLPHPFETKMQYERSLRLPLGPEWATKTTFQDNTKPRVLVKQGIIAPMSKPLL